MKSRLAVPLTASLLVASMFIVTAEDTATKRDANSGSTTEKTKSSATVYGAGTNLPVICYLEKQGCTITVKAGASGTVYSVKKSDGKVLCENLTLEQLRAQAPELHQFIKTAMAANSGKNGDARLDVRIR